MDYYKPLTGLRGWAFLQVIIEHYTLPIVMIPLGSFGVTLFFVLSSYLLSTILYKQHLKNDSFNLANYFVKRRN